MAAAAQKINLPPGFALDDELAKPTGYINPVTAKYGLPAPEGDPKEGFKKFLLGGLIPGRKAAEGIIGTGQFGPGASPVGRGALRGVGGFVEDLSSPAGLVLGGGAGMLARVGLPGMLFAGGLTADALRKSAQDIRGLSDDQPTEEKAERWTGAGLNALLAAVPWLGELVGARGAAPARRPAPSPPPAPPPVTATAPAQPQATPPIPPPPMAPPLPARAPTVASVSSAPGAPQTGGVAPPPLPARGDWAGQPAARPAAPAVAPKGSSRPADEVIPGQGESFQESYLEDAARSRLGDMEDLFGSGLGALSGKGKFEVTSSGIEGRGGYGKIGLKRAFPELEGIKANPQRIAEAIRQDGDNPLYLEVKRRASDRLLDESGPEIRGAAESAAERRAIQAGTGDDSFDPRTWGGQEGFGEIGPERQLRAAPERKALPAIGPSAQYRREALDAMKRMDNLGFDTPGQALSAVLHDGPEYHKSWDIDAVERPIIDKWAWARGAEGKTPSVWEGLKGMILGASERAKQGTPRTGTAERVAPNQLLSGEEGFARMRDERQGNLFGNKAPLPSPNPMKTLADEWSGIEKSRRQSNLRAAIERVMQGRGSWTEKRKQLGLSEGEASIGEREINSLLRSK